MLAFFGELSKSIQTHEEVYKHWTSINIFLIRGCCTGNDDIFFTGDPFFVLKKQYCQNVMSKQRSFPYDEYLETKTVSFLNEKKQASALFYTISSITNKYECPSMCFMPTYQVLLFNSSLSMIMKTRGVQNNVTGVTLKN